MLETARNIQKSNLLVYAHADIGSAPSSTASSKNSSINSPSWKVPPLRGRTPIESDKRGQVPPEVTSKTSSRRNSAVSLLSNPADEEPSNFVDIPQHTSADPIGGDSMDVPDDRSLSSTSSTVVSQTAMIDQIRISASEFNAPAPSHIEISMLNKETIDAELQSVLFDTPGNDASGDDKIRSDQPVLVDSAMPPANLPSPPQNTPTPVDAPGPAKRKVHEKTLAAQQRMEELKKKLLAEAPSDAVMAYNVRVVSHGS